MKKTTKTIVKKYDKDGKLLEHTETIIEEESQHEKNIPLLPHNPWNPFATPTYPNPFAPYVGDVWNQPDSGGKIYTNEGGEPLRVTYDEQA